MLPIIHTLNSASNHHVHIYHRHVHHHFNDHARRHGLLGIPPPPKRVSFHEELLVVEFPLTIGDNPGCSSGVPVCCDSKASIKHTVSLDDYEQFKRPIRRHKKQLALTAQQRKELLLKEGYTTLELHQANSKRQQARQQRQRTVDWMELDVTLHMFRKLFVSPKKRIQRVFSRSGRIADDVKQERASMHGDL